MSKTKKASPAAKRALTGAQLAETIRRLVSNSDGDSVRELVRDFIRRGSTWARKKQPAARRLANAVVELGKDEGTLEALLRWLDQADNSFYHRTTREFPNLFLRRPNTAARLRLFVAERGSPKARKLLASAFRAVDAPAGADVATSVIDALERGADHAVGEAVERLITRFEGAPEGGEWKRLRKELDSFLRAVAKAGKARALTEALERRDAELDRRISTIAIYGLMRQFSDLSRRCATDAARRAWRKALGREAKDGKKIGKQVAALVKEDDVEHALHVLVDDVLAPLDDRFGGGGEHSAEVLNDAMAELAKAKVLVKLLGEAKVEDAAFEDSHPHVIYVGALHRLRSAIDRVGSDKTKAAFREAMGLV